MKIFDVICSEELRRKSKYTSSRSGIRTGSGSDWVLVAKKKSSITPVLIALIA
jgi:hypothetical protein